MPDTSIGTATGICVLLAYRGKNLGKLYFSMP